MSILRQATRRSLNQHIYHALNAFVVPANYIPEEIGEVTARLKSEKPKSKIDGQLISVKDNICTIKEPTTCASAILDGFVSPYAATVVEKIEDAGAIVVGKTNMDEFGMGSHSVKSTHGPVKSHLGTDQEPISAGGSSGGSAVAVATGQCFAALGTDTGGSVRLPAAYTGTVGFKPSYGLVSRYGVVAYANSLDTVGVLARNSRVARALFDVVKGFDERDPTSISRKSRSRIQESLQRHKSSSRQRYRIGVPKEYNTRELEPSVRQAWLDTLGLLRNRGHSICSVSLPATKSALAAYYVIAPAEASSNLAKYDGVRYGNKLVERDGTDNVLYAATRGAGLGEEVKKRILLGSYSLSAEAIDNYFIKAQKVRRLVQNDFNNAFSFPHPLLSHDDKPYMDEGVDVIITPTAQSLPPKLSTVAKRGSVDTYSDDVLTVPASLAGLPAISVPVPIEGLKSRYPDQPRSVGLQILAQYGDDDSVFEVAKEIEDISSYEQVMALTLS